MFKWQSPLVAGRKSGDGIIAAGQSPNKEEVRVDEKKSNNPYPGFTFKDVFSEILLLTLLLQRMH